MACGCRRALSRRAILRAAATTGALPLAGCGDAVPDWLAELLVPEALAAELGTAAFREILQNTPPLADPGLQRRVAAVGERIVAASDSSWADWRFVVLASPQVNAFALPGGHVGVFAGMLEVTQDEAQLATVLGHEVAHVNARHPAERIVAENAVALAIRLGASLLALSDAPVPPELVAALGGTAADLGLIRPFGRSQELEADALGLTYMARAGYNPAASIAFWRRMLALEEGRGVPAFLSTHPAGERRIERLRELLPTVTTSA